MIAQLQILAGQLSPISPGNLPHASADSGTISTVLSIVFGIVGALALLVITIGGLRYITAAGSPEKTTNAKNSIVYALIGLVIAISGEAIVAFVSGKL